MSEDPRIDTIRQLSSQLRRIENQRTPHPNKLVSTGISALDHLLPCGGIERGTIIEWLAKSAGSGAGTLVFTIAAWHMQPTGTLVVIDPRRQFYPPAAARLGVDLERTIVVCPNNTRDTLWSLEQSLLCPGVAVSACHLEDLDDRVFRRLQLATETGGGLGLLLRSTRFHQQPSWAGVRLLVEGMRNEESGAWSQESGVKRKKKKKKKTEKQQPSDHGSRLATRDPPDSWLLAPGSFPPGSFPPGSSFPHERHLQVKLLRCRRHSDNKTILIGINDETGLVRLVSELAPATNPSHAARA